jgi:transitional endoplasmic reticulum ATPase
MPQVFVQLPSGQTFSTQVPIEEMEAFSQVMHILAERLHLRLGMAAGIRPMDIELLEEPKPTETKQLKAPDKSMPPGNYTKKSMNMADVQPSTLTPTPFRKSADDEANDGTTFKEVRILREGTQIIIPEGMSYPEAHIWLKRQEEAEEKKVAIFDKIACYPLDGIVAVMRALKEVYGFASLEDTPGFFGEKEPPMMVQVPLANGGFETAPLGRIAIPKWEGGFFDTELAKDAALVLRGEIKRKFEPEVKRIIALARQRLKEQSIYKGQAITIDLSFIDEDRRFNPINDAPNFIDVKNVDENMLILNDVTDFELRANVFTLIEKTEACLRNNIPLKHGCLLMGPYGTGKTLAARVLASKCVRNGWTFIYLKNAEQLADALVLAQLYAPAVVFAEDIDQVMSGDRDGDINEILNTIDGVDTKDKPIITILTTNKPEDIEPAFLRAGRIDTVISLDAPDGKTSVRFVQMFARNDDGHSLLVKDIDLTEAGKELAGFVPSFIAEAVQKAKRFAIHREGTEIMGKVTANDLVLAAKALKKHIEMVESEHKPTSEQLLGEAVQRVHQYQTTGAIDGRASQNGNGE